MDTEPGKHDPQPSIGTGQSEPTKPERRIDPRAWLVIGVAGLAWGIGQNIDRYWDTSVAWATLASLPGLGGAIYFARRLGGWLFLFIPASLMLMIVLSIVAESATVGPVSWVKEQSIAEAAGCENWSDMSDDLGLISNGVIGWNQNIQLAQSETTADELRWSQQAGTIRQQYEVLDHPAALDNYVQLAIATFTNYEQGFAALSRGDYSTGNAFLDSGDALIDQARAAFNAANVECA